MKMKFNPLLELIELFLKEGKFTPKEIKLGKEECINWVRLKNDPQKFDPKIFEGDWCFSTNHPADGSLRLLRIITASDGVTRIVARQNKYLYAFPLI
jgi:hypothetical protein